MKLLRELLIIPVLLCIVVIAAGIGAPASAESQHYYAWQPVGNSGFSDGRTFEESLFIYDGIPYLAYHAAELTVMKYTGSSWEPVGNPGFSTGDASCARMITLTNASASTIAAIGTRNVNIRSNRRARISRRS